MYERGTDPQRTQGGAASKRARGLVGVTVTCTREERERLKREALATGQTLSAYLLAGRAEKDSGKNDEGA